MNDIERQQKLLNLAENDSIYQLWSLCYAENQAIFEEFANTQPEHILNVLWGYAESGRLIYQRLMNLAWSHMMFPEESTSCPNPEHNPPNIS